MPFTNPSGNSFAKSEAVKAWLIRVSFANNVRRLFRIVDATKTGAMTTALAISGALSAVHYGQGSRARSDQGTVELMKMS